MRYVSFVLFILVSVSVLACSVLADSVGAQSAEPVETVPPTETVPVVALDPQSIEDIADAVNATEPLGDDLPVDAEPTLPVVDLSPDAISSLGQAVGDAVASATVPDVAVNSAGGVSGGYYIVVDCALGNGVKFWIPADFKSGSLAYSDDGLVNMTNSTIYLLPDDSRFDDYIISAGRFSTFQYRRTNYGNYDWADLAIRDVTDSNISFLDDTPQALPDDALMVMVVVLLLLGILSILFLLRRR